MKAQFPFNFNSLYIILSAAVKMMMPNLALDLCYFKIQLLNAFWDKTAFSLY